MKKETMQIKFEGQEHQIDSNTLINALIHYNTIIAEANKELGGGARSVSVKVNAIEKGSFVIDIALLENVIASIFSSGSVGYYRIWYLLLEVFSRHIAILKVSL